MSVSALPFHHASTSRTLPAVGMAMDGETRCTRCGHDALGTATRSGEVSLGSLGSVASASTGKAGGGLLVMPDSESTAVVSVVGSGPVVGAAGSVASGAHGGGLPSGTVVSDRKS